MYLHLLETQPLASPWTSGGHVASASFARTCAQASDSASIYFEMRIFGLGTRTPDELAGCRDRPSVPHEHQIH